MYFNKVSNCKINLVTFNSEISTEKKFTIKDGQWLELKDHLDNLIYDGASSFSILSNYNRFV